MTEDITTTGAIDADEDALLVLLAAGGGVFFQNFSAGDV